MPDNLEDGRILIIIFCQKGEENCGELIEAHKACMRALGFKIQDTVVC